MSSIDAIVKLVPPPVKPVEVGGKKNWARVEKQLGAKLPSDYKAFIDRYGSGEFAGFYVVYNPFSRTVNLLEKFESHGKNYAESHDSDPENCPLAVFPEVPGILPWGHDTNGHTYFWFVKDKKKPDEWTVVWDEGDDQGFEEHDFTFGEYLLGVLQGEIDPLAGNYPNEESFVFKPFEVGDPDPRLNELTAAIKAEDVKRVRELAAAGVDVNAPSTENFLSPIITASRMGAAMVKLLLELGADPRKEKSDRTSPLSGPVYGNDFESVQALLDAGADVNATWTRWGHNALCDAHDERMIRLLLAAGCKPTGADYSSGRTPLYFAIENDNPGLVRLLIEHGADVNAKILPKKKVSPLSFAKGLKRKEIVKILKQAGAKE